MGEPLNTKTRGEHVKALGLSYEQDDKGLHFEDGVDYTLDEAMHISKKRATEEDIRAIHMLKKVFDGQVITGNEKKRLALKGVNMEVSQVRLEELKERKRWRQRRYP